MTAGNPVWSPDGKRIVCGLSVPNAGALLHVFSLEDGKVRPLQSRLQGGPVGMWVDASWSGIRKELFFGHQRGPAPQIWSMPSEEPPLLIQLPLTRYRPEDITLMHSLSAIPDGSGVVYSADVVNGKGDYELYRVPAKGGAPTAITNTIRDEFSPAVSPDGKRIAHVSNHLGNVDIFLMPIAGGEKKHVRLEKLSFRIPSGQVRVRVQDETGANTPVRLYVRAGDGKAYAPPGRPIFYYPLEPRGPREGFFIGKGDDTFPVPAGTLRLVAVKGVEYEITERFLEIPANEIAEVTIQLRRWTNWNQRGWYTGENHFHANYNGNYYQKPVDSLNWLQAQDLNSANMIVANAAGAFVHDKEFFTGKPHPLSSNRYVLSWGEEYRNSFPLGHMGFVNISKLVPPFYTSVIGSNSPYDYPLNTVAALDARKVGGFVTYMHPFTMASADVFDTNLGAKESPITAALGALDSIDVLPGGGPAYELWYRLLNSGFAISPGAGTDAFTNWRGINRLPGSARSYVEIGPVMNWERWVERHREGRNFVTSGPLLTFQLNGQPIGSRIRASSGQPYKARLAAEIWSPTPLRRVEFLQNGAVIAAREVADASKSLRLEQEVDVDRSSWFAVRVSGIPARGFDASMAHSGAIYVLLDGKPPLVREDLELMVRWVDRLWLLLEERNNFGPGDNRARAQKMFDQARSHFTSKLGSLR
jgi:hypothetical protein